MKEKIYTRTNAKGTEFKFIFEIDEANDHLRLKDVTVKGASVMQELDYNLIEGVYNECFHNWIMATA